MTVPLVILAVLSLIGGFVEIPLFHPFSTLIENSLPAVIVRSSGTIEFLFQSISAIIALTGIYHWLI